MKGYLQLTAAVMLLAGSVPATTSASAGICLHERDIKSTMPSPDGKTLTMVMRDGKVWQNRLQGACPDLKFRGFAWVIRGPEGVCENSQSLKVLESGQVCVLGKFTPVKSAPRGTK